MLENGLNAVNFSLDTLVKERFERITRRRGWERVVRGVERAVDSGFGVEEGGKGVVKVNVVVMRGVNNDEILEFVEFTRHRPIEVRFIEYMPFDVHPPSPSPPAASHQLLINPRETPGSARK